ncbi:hypothetical protein TWF696_006854 [Orbilia brochopaga]|uniref:Uncharacterized protein n=1 Tax=Orbilia brochopaga TaxID=3140254 RepID=A0AAV9UTS1_9PEZI
MSTDHGTNLRDICMPSACDRNNDCNTYSDSNHNISQNNHIYFYYDRGLDLYLYNNQDHTGNDSNLYRDYNNPCLPGHLHRNDHAPGLYNYDHDDQDTASLDSYIYDNQNRAS